MGQAWYAPKLQQLLSSPIRCQTKVANWSLGDLLRCLTGTKPKQWDMALPQAELAYNRSTNRTTDMIPFQVVYGRNPPSILDLVPIPRVGRVNPQDNEMATHLHNIHAHVHSTIQASNAQYKLRVDHHHRQVLFDVGD